VALDRAPGEGSLDPADQEERERREAAEYGDAGTAFLGDAGSALLRRLIANDAAAKRCLCAIEAGYDERLSPVSRQTFAHQGEPMSPVECAEMERHPRREELIAVRHFRGRGQGADQLTPDLAHYRPMLERQLRPDPTVS
jgi:predicted HD phosphohydrolase